MTTDLPAPFSDLEEVQAAVARGWTYPETSHLVMDPVLANTIVIEVLGMLYQKIDSAVMRAERAEAVVEAAQALMANLIHSHPGYWDALRAALDAWEATD
jgi:hypothetical protein